MQIYELAEINIGRMIAPLTDPAMREFADALGPINAAADASPGFVWRQQGESGNNTAARPFGDDILVNISVWESVEALQAYVYRSAHMPYLKDRKRWFTKMDQAFFVMWWVPAGHRPTAEEAKARLEHLMAHGESAKGFTFRNPFPPPGSAAPMAAAGTTTS